MCLCDLAEQLRASLAPPPVSRPLVISPTSAPLEVTDGLVDLANDLLGHAPRQLRQLVLDQLGLTDSPDANIPYLSVARAMGRQLEHAAAVRAIIGMSTLAEIETA